MKSNGWAMLAIGLGVGLVVGYIAAPDASSGKLNPAERELGANLYIQAAPEYRALCLQTYRYAWDSLQRRLAAPPAGELPFAIIMDLDETVFDNSGYQNWLYRHGLSYSTETWAKWEEKGRDEVELVPGALDFIEKVEQLEGSKAVAVYYISNRRDHASTLKALQKHQLDRKPNIAKRLLVRIGSSDKESRRELVRRDHRILMLIGDQMSDFSSDFFLEKEKSDEFKPQADARNARLERVDRCKQHLGYDKDSPGPDWIILPNPVYGDWLNRLGKEPAKHLRSTKFRP